MSGEWHPLNTAADLVRHLLRWDCSADEIMRRLEDNVLWHFATLEDVKTCRRLLAQRRRWDTAVVVELAAGRPPTEEGIADHVDPKVSPRTVQRWRHGDTAP